MSVTDRLPTVVFRHLLIDELEQLPQGPAVPMQLERGAPVRRHVMAAAEASGLENFLAGLGLRLEVDAGRGAHRRAVLGRFLRQSRPDRDGEDEDEK